MPEKLIEIPKFNGIYVIILSELSSSLKKGKSVINLGGLSFSGFVLKQKIKVHKTTKKERIGGLFTVEKYTYEADKKDREFLKDVYHTLSGDILIIGTEEQAKAYPGLVAYIENNEKLITF